MLNAYTASVRCNLGNGNVGYFFITAQPALFTIASLTAFVKQVNPGVLVLAQPPPATAVLGHLHASILKTFTSLTTIIV